MTILDVVVQYKKRIHEHIKTHPQAQHDDILRDLLKDYPSKSDAANPSALFQQKSTSFPLAKALAEVKAKDDDIIDLVNTYLKDTPLDKNDDMFALLTAYFYYFEDLHTTQELRARGALYKQILVPLHLYRERVEKDRIDYLIEKTNDISVARAAYFALAENPIQKNQLKTLVDALLAKLDDKNPGVRHYAYEALEQIPFPVHQRAAIVKVLLARLDSKDPGVRLTECATLGKIPIPKHLLEAVVTALLTKVSDHNENLPVSCEACSTLGRIPIPEHLLEAVVTALLAKLNDEGTRVRWAACTALGRIPIPENQRERVGEAVIAALLTALYDPKVTRKAHSALRRISIPEHQKESVIAILLTNLSDSDSFHTFLALFEKIPLLNERMVMVARLEALQDSLTDPLALIPLQTLIQTCQSKNVIQPSLLQHLIPPEKIVEIVEQVDKKLR